jgi:signal transduction histidine kinase/ligand-binding sensor domain-containing protein/DNA-binding response OmpR family regulator
MKKFLYISFVLLLIICSKNYAQQNERRFKSLTVDDGLSNSTIYCIYQDKKGYMWIGTSNGLNKYDGYNFTIYKHNTNNINTISDDFITSIDEDSKGNIWVGVWFGGLNKFDPETEKFTTYLIEPVEASSKSNNVWDIHIDKEDNIWVGTLGGGLYLFDKTSATFKQYAHQPSNPDGISNNFVTSIYEDENDFLWIGTNGGGLNCFDKKKEVFLSYQHDPNNPNSLASNYINKLFIDKEKNLWIGTVDQGISILSPNRQQFTNHKAKNLPNNLNNNNVRSFFQDENNIIWIGTDGGGINFYDPKLQSFHNFKHIHDDPNGINTNVIFCLYKSKDNIVWVGNFQGGLNIYDKNTKKFQTYSYSDNSSGGLSYKTVMSVFEDSDNKIWIGTDGGGVNRYDPKTKEFKYYLNNSSKNKSISGNAIKSIFEDSGGNLWFGTYANGLNCFNKDSEEFTHYKHDPSDTTSLSNNDVWDIAEDLDNNLWIATLNGGLNLLDKETMTFKRFHHLYPDNNIINGNIFSICVDKKKGGLWVGAITGLCYFDAKNKTIKNYLKERNSSSSLSSNDINVIYQDSQFNIWIGTKKGGLNLYNPASDNFTLYTEEDGLISDEIAAIIEDDQHNIWISSNKGLSKFDPKEKTFSSYTSADGLQSNEFMQGAACKTKNGELIFGGINGFNIFRPENIKNNYYIPEVYITRLLISNKEMKPGDEDSPLTKVISETKEISLNHKQNVISFELTALNYTNSDKNQYAYKLEGFDAKNADWNYVGNRRLITFTNLNPKTYTLTVIASNNDGIWNKTGTSLTIHILPPWWRTMWFKLFFILFLITITLFWFRIRLYSIKKQKQKLEGLVLHRTKELAEEKEKVELQNKKILKQSEEIKLISELVHKADQEKLQFFTNISHEIKTPLTLILGPLEKLLNSQLPRVKINDQLNRIHRNALNLKHLINQILYFRKIESNSTPLKATKCDILKLIKESTFAFSEIAKQNNIKFYTTSKFKTLEGWIDREKFDKILSNLLSNAFKFTKKGGEVSIHVSKTVDKIEKRSFQYAKIQVKDNGIGISSDKIGRVFERFYQVENASEEPSGGSGIGLSIVKLLTELHYGKINVESNLGKGTCFTLLIPLGKEHLNSNEILVENLKPVLTSEKKRKPLAKNGSPKLLIVEDNLDLRLYLNDILNEQYEVIEAKNGKEGLILAKRHYPTLILADIMMPKMDGLEMCNKLKTNIKTSHISIILLTAKSLHSDKIEGLKIGADDYIYKPFDKTELETRIKNLIMARERMKEKFSRELVLKPHEITLTSADEKFLKKAMEIVESHISDSNFDIQTFVSKMAVSRTVLHMKLKELTNQSATDFVRTIRLKRAAQLILQKKASISEISHMVGFTEVHYFNRCFKKQFNTTPSNYNGK